MDDFLLRALAAGLGLTVISGPLGVFVVWLRMAYFGDTLAHSALLGIALGLLFEVDLQLSVLVLALFIAVALLGLQQRSVLATDTLLGILAHGTLAIGLVAISFRDDVRVDLLAYLFGDILAVGNRDVLWIWTGALLSLAALLRIWRPLLNLSVHAELAAVDGVKVARVKLAFMLLVALVIAVAMKLVGVLLITALLIIPAAAAQRFSRSPEQMAWLATLVGALAVSGGLAGSLLFDTPAGPSIVSAATVLFLLSQLRPVHRA
ncbi:MAG: zinc ABC transporter permease subunit ZnuB [Chromatiaceae bacterium]|nr:zinc ABC transporter permease subunit ZnuB [Chromatiaceae bacterium]